MSRSWFPRDSQLTILSASTATTADDTDGLGGVIIDLGSGRFDGQLVFDVSAIDTSSSDESYDFIVQVSNSATFASGVEEAARRKLGHTSTRFGAGTSGTGRYVIPFSNETPDGTEYRYLRVPLDVAGTTPSVTITAMWVTKARDALDC